MFFKKVKHLVIKNANNFYLNCPFENAFKDFKKNSFFVPNKKNSFFVPNKKNSFSVRKDILKEVIETKKHETVTLDFKNVNKSIELTISYEDLDSISIISSQGIISTFNDSIKCEYFSFKNSDISFINGFRNSFTNFYLQQSSVISTDSIFSGLELELDSNSKFKGQETIIYDLYPRFFNKSIVEMDSDSYIFNCLEFWSGIYHFTFHANVISFLQMKSHSLISEKSNIKIFGEPDLKYSITNKNELTELNSSKFIERFYKQNSIVKSLKNSNSLFEDIFKQSSHSLNYEYKRPQFIQDAKINNKDETKLSSLENLDCDNSIKKEKKLSVKDKIIKKDNELKNKREANLLKILNEEFPTDFINEKNRVEHINAIENFDFKKNNLSNYELSNLKKLKIIFNIEKNKPYQF